MKKRTIFLSILAALAMGVSVLAGLSRVSREAVHAAQEDEELIETFEYEDYTVVDVSTLEEFKAVSGGGNYYINLRSNILTQANDPYINVGGRKYINMNGFAFEGARAGVLHITTASMVTIVHGRIAPYTLQSLDNNELWYKNTISVYNATLILRDVSVIGTYSAISIFNSRVDVRDGCDIDSGRARYGAGVETAFNCAAFSIGGSSTVNVQGGSVTGYSRPSSWSFENYGVSYSGDAMNTTNSKINLSGGKRSQLSFFNTSNNQGATENQCVHIYGGKLYMYGFRAIDSDYDNLGHDNKFNKDNIYQYLRDRIQTNYDFVHCVDDTHKVSFINSKGGTYNDIVDAILSEAEYSFWYVQNATSDAVTVTNPSEMPSGTLYKAGYTLEINKHIEFTAVLNQKMALNNSLSFRKVGALEVEKTVVTKEKVAAYTKYHDNVDYLAYRGAQRQTYEWTLTNNATGYSKTEKGYASYVIPTGNVGIFTLSCKITATNKYNLEQQVTTNTVTLTVTTNISNNVKIEFSNGASVGSDYVTAVFDELVPLRVSSETNLDYNSGAKLTYQWYASYSSDGSDQYPLPGATKSIYNYKVDYIGKRYLYLGVQAVQTSGAYDFTSEEVLSNILCVEGKDFEKLYVRQDYNIDYDVALGTEVLFQVSVIGPAEATNLKYQWFIENEDGTHSQLSETNSVNVTYTGTKTSNLTVRRNDKKGTFYYYCYVTDVRNNMSQTSKSAAFSVTYRDAGQPIIKTQPQGGRYQEGSSTNVAINGLSATSPDLGASLSYKWYKSTTCYAEGDTYCDPKALTYSATSYTSAAPQVTMPEVGIWFYYCEVTNTVNGYKTSINTNYVEINIVSREHDVTVRITEQMEEEIVCEVGDTIHLEYQFEVTARGSLSTNNIGVYGSIYCDELNCGGSIAPAATLLPTSSGQKNYYSVSVDVKLTNAGSFIFDGDAYAYYSGANYDSEQVRGSFGANGLLTRVRVLPKDNTPEFVNVSKNATSELLGNFDVGNMDYYRTGDVGATYSGSNVYDKQLNNYGPLADYDNFKKYELYVENASGVMVKAGESTDRNKLPSFNFNTYNEGLDAADRFSNDYDGSLKAFVRVVYDEVNEILDIPVSGGGIDYPVGIYVETDQSYDSDVFDIVLTADCSHQDSRYERCNHTTNQVEVICYGCGEIVETMALHLTHVEEESGSCTSEGLKAHDVCPYCGKMFVNGEEVNPADLIITSKDHDLIHHEAKEATCTEKGNVDYYECKDCHEYFILGDNGYIEVSLEDVMLDIHHEAASEWSHNSQGHYHVCEKCGQIIGEVEPHVDEDSDGFCDICNRDLNAAVETVHVTVVNGTFADGTTEMDVEVGGVVSVIANRIEGKEFEGWYINNTKVSSDETAQIVINEACTIEARFADSTPIVPPVDPDKPNKGNAGLPAGAVVGISIGAVLLLAIGGFAIVWFVVLKKTFADLKAVFKKK